MTGYIAEMRKIVGHKTIIQCAASIICVDKDGRILLGKRSDNKGNTAQFKAHGLLEYYSVSLPKKSRQGVSLTLIYLYNLTKNLAAQSAHLNYAVLPKKWGYSGGAVEIDEYVEDCAKRELFEEMGLVAEELEFFFVNSGPEAHYIYPNGDEVSNFEVIYLCRKWHGEPKSQDGEMLDLRFFACDEIDLSEISPPIRRVVEKYINEFKELTT